MSTPPEEPTVDDKPPAPLLTLSDGLGPVIDTPAGLADVVDRFAAGHGPVAVDAERASGYRYSARAYLIQLRRDGSGTALIDPTMVGEMGALQEVIGSTEWILHAATQDLPCLSEVGLHPGSLFDTELAGRLLGYPRVGLATLVETALGQALRKEHSAVDWSKRPLPEPWLEYAALDVEPLVALREAMRAELDEAGKSEWARQEFDFLLGFEPTQRAEPWRRTSQLHRVRSRRGLAAVRELWIARDTIAAHRDVTPSRLIPDAAIIAAAQAMPTDRAALLATPGFTGRGASRHAREWITAIREAAALGEDELPARNARNDGPPIPRAWAEKDPEAGQRLALAKEAMTELSEHVSVPTENLLTPDTMRRVLWTPPDAAASDLVTAVGEALNGYRARPWQVELTAPLLAEAILSARAATA
ncbi:HRDC domain-containing protein [Nocardioides sp. Bht2]|uniref:HRDC domain-containing protein n=1 Tax=Nocardioides sp. Bht2 TaxID=3392297 RepID=UPI0039B45445